jgi:hypothetical protein
MQWHPTKQQTINALMIIISLCGLVIAAKDALILTAPTVAIISIVLGLASTVLKLVSNQAIDEALNTPAPADAEHISVLQDALGHAQERIKEGVLPMPKGESGGISIPVPAPPDGETLPAGRVGSQEPQG